MQTDSIFLYEQVILQSAIYIRSQNPPFLQLPKSPLKNTNKIAIIVDPRYDKLMEAVIMNFMYFMFPQGWNFIIVSAEKYKNKILHDFPQASFSLIDEQIIYYDDKETPNITIQTYNNTFMNMQFWESVPSEHVAIFQKDCIMYNMFSDEWPTKYDFSGAFWKTDETSLLNGVINGGFSLRKKSAMINCIKHVSWEEIEIYRKNTFTCNETYYPIVKKNEDVFFTYACEILNYQLPAISIRKQLAIEAEYHVGTSVFHGWTKGYQTREQAVEMLLNSPLFKLLLHFEPLDIPPQDPPYPSQQQQNQKLEIIPQPSVKSDPEIPISIAITPLPQPQAPTVFILPEKSEPEILI